MAGRVARKCKSKEPGYYKKLNGDEGDEMEDVYEVERLIEKKVIKVS